MRWLLRLGAALTVGLAAAALARLPFANGPAEWEWPWQPDAPGWRLAGAAALALVAVAAAGAAGRIRPRAALTLLVLLGWLFTLALAAAQPAGFGRIAASLASRHSFGYLWDAALAPPSRELLADYPRLSRRLGQHARTHPPGALLAVRALDGAGRRLEDVVSPGQAGPLATARHALTRERQRAGDRGRPVPRLLPSPWTVLLLAGLLPGLSALAALPLHALALRLGLAPTAGLLAAAIWALVPARSLFTPSLDQALPLLLVGAAALAAGEAWARRLVAGALLGLAGLTSYGALAVAPLVAAVAWWSGGARRAVLPLAAGFTLPWTALTLLARYDPWASFVAAMGAHRAIAVAPRGYLTWLLWNPYDFALLLGPAVALLALGALAVRGPLRAIAAVFWSTLALLLLSGGVRGEVGRIWLPFMPWACLLAAAVLARRDPPAGLPVLALEAMLACALAAAMVFVA